MNRVAISFAAAAVVALAYAARHVEAVTVPNSCALFRREYVHGKRAVTICESWFYADSDTMSWGLSDPGLAEARRFISD